MWRKEGRRKEERKESGVEDKEDEGKRGGGAI